jgi:hemoglobin-like flavoprotein
MNKMISKKNFATTVSPILIETFAKVKAVDPSFKTQGVLLFRNIFALAPDAL